MRWDAWLRESGAGGEVELRTGRPLGMDEIMIVNPAGSRSGLFLGDDGELYEVPRLAASTQAPGPIGEFFIGDDGTLYQSPVVAPRGPVGARAVIADGGIGRFLLGEDGTLYGVVR